jgi:hypothetical protein
MDWRGEITPYDSVVLHTYFTSLFDSGDGSDGSIWTNLFFSLNFPHNYLLRCWFFLACLTAVDQYSYGPMAETTDRLCLFENFRVAVVAVSMVENGVSHAMGNHNSPFFIIDSSCRMCVVVLF